MIKPGRAGRKVANPQSFFSSIIFVCFGIKTAHTTATWDCWDSSADSQNLPTSSSNIFPFLLFPRLPQSGDLIWGLGRSVTAAENCYIFKQSVCGWNFVRCYGSLWPYSLPRPGTDILRAASTHQGTHHALVDSGCVQTLIHQSLIQAWGFVEVCRGFVEVKVHCIHVDELWSIVPLIIICKGQKHCLKSMPTGQIIGD